MKKPVFYAVIALLCACNNQTQEQKSTNDTDLQQITTEEDNSEIFRKNFAIVWKWNTKNRQLIEDNISEVSIEMTKLWEKDVIENAYFNQDIDVDKFEYFPNISCFLKTSSLEEAEKTLNNLILVEKGLAEYTIYPVGSKFLGRNTGAIIKRGSSKSYVAVWSTPKKVDPDKDRDLIIAQSDALLKLWNEGSVENVYFDIEGTQKANNVTDFVFFINVNSEDEAKEICNNLPFSREKKATYKLLHVGIFWLGEYKQ